VISLNESNGSGKSVCPESLVKLNSLPNPLSPEQKSLPRQLATLCYLHLVAPVSILPEQQVETSIHLLYARYILDTPSPRAQTERPVCPAVDVDDAHSCDDGLGQPREKDKDERDKDWEKEVSRLITVPSAIRLHRWVCIDLDNGTEFHPHAFAFEYRRLEESKLCRCVRLVIARRNPVRE
jgi:hypothetical protein